MTVASLTMCFAYDKKKDSSELFQKIYSGLDNLNILGSTQTQIKFPDHFLEANPTFRDLKEAREKIIKQVINNGHGLIYLVQSIEPYISVQLYILRIKMFKTPKLNFSPDLEVVIFYGNFQQIPVNDTINTPKFLETMVGLIPIIDPVFAWGDDWKKIIKQETKDPRQFIWGVNYWSKELTEKIGIDKIEQMRGNDWQVKKHPTGGISLSAFPLPFAALQGQKNKAAKQLNLTEKLKNVLIIGPEVKKQTAKDDFW